MAAGWLNLAPILLETRWLSSCHKEKVVMFLKLWLVVRPVRLSGSVLDFCTEEFGVEIRLHTILIVNRSGLRLRYQVYTWPIRDFDSRRYNSVSFAKGSMELRKRATCSLIFPLWSSKFWNLGTLYPGGIALEPLYRGKAASSLRRPLLWRLFPFLFDHGLYLSLVINTDDSLDRLAGSRAGNRLSTLGGVMP